MLYRRSGQQACPDMLAYRFIGAVGLLDDAAAIFQRNMLICPYRLREVSAGDQSFGCAQRVPGTKGIIDLNMGETARLSGSASRRLHNVDLQSRFG